MTKPAKPYYANPGPSQRARDKFAVVAAFVIAVVAVIVILTVIAFTFFWSP